MADRERHIGVVGIGGIATKAYLPLLATWPGVRLHLASRDERRLQEASRTFHAASATTDAAALLERDLDAVLITAATPAHPHLVAAALRAGVAVHVDKPLADSYEEAERLTDLAESVGIPLVVGFNRRFAPAYRHAAQTRPHLAVMHKHRPDLDDDVRRVVFDDLIHVVDTLRWLLTSDGPDDAVRGIDDLDIAGRVVEGRLHHVALTLHCGDRHGVGLMDRRSGTTHERLETHGSSITTVVEDLAAVSEHGRETVTGSRPDVWTPTLSVRGFTAMLAGFLDAITAGRPPSPAPRDALESHRLCEAVVRHLSGNQPRTGDSSFRPDSDGVP